MTGEGSRPIIQRMTICPFFKKRRGEEIILPLKKTQIIIFQQKIYFEEPYHKLGY